MEGTLQHAGLMAAPSLIVEGDWSAASGEQGMRRLLEQCPDIDAVFACNDQMALGALGVCIIRPFCSSRLAIAGLDDIPEAAFSGRL